MQFSAELEVVAGPLPRAQARAARASRGPDTAPVGPGRVGGPPTAAMRATDAQSLAAAVLDAVPLPTWVCQRDATVVIANAAAQPLPTPFPWPRVRCGRLVGAVEADTLSISRALSCLAPSARPGAIALSATGEVPLLLRCSALGDEPALAGVWPRASALLMLEAWPLARRDSLSLARVGLRFSLTPSEAAVLQDLAQGATVADIAARRHVAPVTVRTHLRALFDKTGRRRQADLVRLVMSE